MMLKPLVVAALLSGAAYADTMSARLLQGCDYVPSSQTIFCFGGTTGSVDVYHNFAPTNDIFTLNVSSSLSPNSATNSWTKLPQPTNYATEARAEFAHVLVNETRFIMMSGAGSGNTYTQSSLKNVTSWYDTSSNTWGTYTQSTIPITWDGGSGQIIPFNVTPLFNQLQGVSVATIVHNGSTTWTTAPQLSGGLRLDNANYINDAVTSSYPIFTANDSNWNQIMVAGSNHPNAQPRSFRAQAVRSENDRIWFFGGMQYNISTNGMPYTGQDVASDAVTFSSFPYMDNAAGYFNISYNSASNIPSTRYWHSATLLPGKGQILIFGGVYSGKACPDFAYLFDTNTLKWTQPNVVGASAQARYGHSAVMVGKNLLYIMFGADVSGNLLNRVDILNTTSWTFLDAGVNNSQSNGGSSGGGVPGGSSGMSVGTIAGIAVGVVVGVGLLIGASVAFICIRRRRSEEIPEAPALFQQLDHQPEMMNNQPPPPTQMSTTGPQSVNSGSTYFNSPVKPMETGPVKPMESVHGQDRYSMVKPYAEY